MELATLCDVELKINGTNRCHMAIFSVDVLFSHHFVAPLHPPLYTPIGVLAALATPVTNYPKWQTIQLVIHSTLGA